MRNLLFPLICLIGNGLSAQDLQAKIDSLYWTSKGLKYGERISTARRILDIDPFNSNAHTYIVESYVLLDDYERAYSYIDSIFKLSDPDPEVVLSLSYGLRHLAPKDSVYDFFYFRILLKCLEFDETKEEAAYYLSYAYYKDFIKPFRKDPPTITRISIIEADSISTYKWAKESYEIIGISYDSILIWRSQIKPLESVYQYSGDSALKYLRVLSNSESPYSQITEIPIAQLEEYLGIKSTYQLDSNLYNNHYFPEWYFGYLAEDWKNDFSTDLFHEMLLTSYGSVVSLSEYFNSLNEPILYPKTEHLTYRITWLPSFHHPIVIRIVREESNCKIIWKASKGGYGLQGVENEGESPLSISEFERISGVLDNTNICNENHYDYLVIVDGVSLILEKASENQFCAHKTNLPSEEVKTLLIGLAKTYFKEIDTEIFDY